VGVFESANGTLFLDEIIPISVQVSMLRVLQEREIIRLGETRQSRCSPGLCHQSQFKSSRGKWNIQKRIRVAIISLPLLRERKGDIPLLINNFLKRCRVSIGKKVQGVDNDTINILMNYHWPGNVRERIESAVIRCRGTVLTPHAS
jgi:transcriptional regulator with PAS, ATPase and Fis domain